VHGVCDNVGESEPKIERDDRRRLIGWLSKSQLRVVILPEIVINFKRVFSVDAARVS
jgi:hypothetical protein